MGSIGGGTAAAIAYTPMASSIFSTLITWCHVVAKVIGGSNQKPLCHLQSTHIYIIDLRYMPACRLDLSGIVRSLYSAEGTASKGMKFERLPI